MNRDALITALALHASHELSPAAARAVVDALYPDLAIDCNRWHVEAWAGVVVRAEPWADTEEMAALHTSFAAELGEPHDVDLVRMAELHRAGRMLTITARCDDALIGMLRCFIVQHHRTGELIGHDDLCYIAPDHRGGMLPVRLGQYIEKCLRDLGCTWAEARMRTDNNTPALARRRGYEPFAQHFRKRLLTE